jgi:hypothetical protein
MCPASNVRSGAAVLQAAAAAFTVVQTVVLLTAAVKGEPPCSRPLSLPH